MVTKEPSFKKIYRNCSYRYRYRYLMGSGSLSNKPPSVKMDEQPWWERLLLHPGEAGHRNGRRILPRERQQLLTVLERGVGRSKSQNSYISAVWKRRQNLVFFPYLSFSQLKGNQTYVDRPGAPVCYRRWHSGSETGVGGQRKAQSDRRQSQGVVHLHWTGGDSAETLQAQTRGRTKHCDNHENLGSSVGKHLTLPTVIRPDSVRFQKDFQNCIFKFWVMRSNSAPRNSGSMTYLPDVRRESAAMPGRE